MTTITNLTSDVISYLVAQCQINAALAGVAVSDGPTPPGELMQTSQQALWIGFDALSGSSEAGTATQTFAYMGSSAGRRREDGSVTCTAQAWSGDPTVATARLACKGIVGAVEVMLRGYPGTLGPVLGDSSMGGLVQWSQVEGPFTWTQSQDGSGFSAMCVFRITYTAYLNP